MVPAWLRNLFSPAEEEGGNPHPHLFSPAEEEGGNPSLTTNPNPNPNPRPTDGPQRLLLCIAVSYGGREEVACSQQ